jgi:hypothetical protein
MTLQDLGSISELVGGIGVVVSLVYLAFEIRLNTRGLDQNTETMRLSVENEIRSELNGFRMSLATDDTLSSIWSRGLRGEELDPNDHARFDLLLLNIVAMITAQIHAHQRGYYDLERRIPYFSFIATTPGFQRFWQQRALRDTVREDVRAYIDSLLEPSPNSEIHQIESPPAV